VFGSAVAVADPKPVDPKAKARAAELATQSQSHYKRGEFEVSIALLRQAYALYPEPNLLYNLARSLEGLGDAKGALEAYKSYLAANEKAEDRGAIERRIATLEVEIAEKEKRDKPAPAPVVVQPKPAPAQITTQSPPPPSGSKLPIVVIATGAAIIGGGVFFGLAASDRHDQAIAEPNGLEAQRLQDSAKTRATLANVMFIAGGAVAIGGVVWAIAGRRGRREATSVRAKVGPGVAQLELVW
jgi:tetratricopeptide (TPR) repeat protein